MEILKKKLGNIFSRKFLLSTALVVGGLGTALKESSNPEVQIVGIITACISAVVYSWIEGKVDISAIESTVAGAIKDVEEIKKGEEAVENE